MVEIWKKMWRLMVSGTMRASYLVVGGNGVSMGLATVFTVLAARWLGPEKWGLVAGVGSLVTILVAIGELGLGAGVLKFVSKSLGEGNRAEVKKTLSAIMLGRLVSALGLGVLLFLLASPLSKLVVGESVPELVYFAVLGLVGFLMLDFQITVVEAEQRWGLAGGLYVLSNGLRLVLLIGLAATGWLSLGSVLAVFCGSALLTFVVSLLWRSVEFSVTGGEWKRLYNLAGFSGWMAVNKIVSTFNSRVDVLLLLPLAGAWEAGIYSAANRLALGVPIILGGLATVLAQRFATFGEKGQMRAFFGKAVMLAVLVSGGLILGILVAPWVVSWFGPDYEPALPVLRWMFAAFIPFVMATPAVNALIYGLNKQKVMALVTVAQLPVVVGLNWYLIPRIGVMAPVVAMGVVNLSMMVVAYGFVLKEIRR